MSFYFCNVHQRGTISAIKELRKELYSTTTSTTTNHYNSLNNNVNDTVNSYNNYSKMMKVLFLVPCHHVPGYSYIHHDNDLMFAMKHLECSPFDEENNSETDRFYRNPKEFLLNYNNSNDNSVNKNDKSDNKNKGWGEGYLREATHLVLYEELGNELSLFFEKYNFYLDKKVFHVHFPHVHDKRMSSHVVIFKKRAVQ